MKKRFTISIDIGNDAMKSMCDVADTIRELLDTVPAYALETKNGVIRDANGNKVGTYKVGRAK